MALYTDTNGFPEGGFPVLSDVQDNLILNTLYQVPQKYLNYRMDVVGDNRLLGNLVIGGTLTGVSSLTMSGALSGVTTLGASSTVTLSSDTAPLTLSGTNAVLSITGSNASIGTILQPVNMAWFKNLNIKNTPLVDGDPLITTANLQAVAVPYSNAHSDVNLGIKLISAGNIETNATSLSTRLGLNALDDENESTAKYNVAIGRNALTSVTTGDYTTAVGTNCGQSVVGGTANSLFGYQCGLNLTSSNNSLFGYQTGSAITSGNTHTAFGYEALKAVSTNSGCVALGYKAGNYETGGNKLFIDNQDRTNEATARTNSMIYGEFNSTPTSQMFRINAKLELPHIPNTSKSTCLYYDASTKEVSYGNNPSATSTILYKNSTDQVTSGTSETTLYSYDLNGGALTTNGDIIEMYIVLISSTSSGTALVDFVIDGTAQTLYSDLDGGLAVVRIIVARVSSTSIKYFVDYQYTAGSTFGGDFTVTDASSINFEIKATSSVGDITGRMFYIKNL